MQRIVSSEKGTSGNAQSGPASGQLAIERWWQRCSRTCRGNYAAVYRSYRRAVDSLLRSLQDRDMRALSSRSSRSPSPWCSTVSRCLQGSKGEHLIPLLSRQNYKRNIKLRCWSDGMTNIYTYMTLMELVLNSFMNYERDYFDTCNNWGSMTSTVAGV